MTNNTESKIQMAMQNYTFFLLIAPNATKDTYQLFKKVYLIKLTETNSITKAFESTLMYFQIQNNVFVNSKQKYSTLAC